MNWHFGPGGWACGQGTKALLIVALLLLGLAAGAHAATEGIDNPDVVNITASLGLAGRLGVYGLGFLVLCLVCRVVPDAPLLCYLFSMSLVQFSGLRIGLMLMQCGIVLLKRRELRYLLPSWPLSLLFVCILASASWALNLGDALRGENIGIGAMLQQLPLTIATMACLRSGVSSVPRMLWTLVLGAAPGCVRTIQNAMAGIRYVQDEDAPDQDEYYMGFIAPDVFSTILVLCGVFLVYVLISRGQSAGKKTLAGLLLPLFCVALMLAGIRSGWIAFGLAAMLLLVWARSVVALGGVFCIAAVVLGLGFSGVTGLNVAEKISGRLSEKSLSSGEIRLRFWEVAGQGFARRPILGIGWGCFPGFAADATLGRPVATHNIYVRLACELGGVGLGFFGAWMLHALQGVWRSPLRVLGGLFMLSVLVQGMFLDHFIASHFWFFLGLCEGMAGTQWHRAEEPVAMRNRLAEPGMMPVGI